ncbi:hypothetical protein [Salarchaeum sp. JOR-1]|uniref:hypothetical protein n=1 Tax=Salarchaeum sp. JOR-1 TaxID=2599399 RepID=UPI001198CBAB|nr:hypothetical protein [Salarchaeum sp. JOR-1]QDX41401.1 hypothetical protein FQU85_11000 [Salarchaeum sp. JOR-1]
MTVTFEASDRLVEGAEEWGNQRMMDTEDALESKVEQALLEIENLLANEFDVDFTVDGTTVHYEPVPDVASFLEAQADEHDVSVAEILRIHVDLYARVFLHDDEERPPNAPGVE